MQLLLILDFKHDRDTRYDFLIQNVAFNVPFQCDIFDFVDDYSKGDLRYARYVAINWQRR